MSADLYLYGWCRQTGGLPTLAKQAVLSWAVLSCALLSCAVLAVPQAGLGQAGTDSYRIHQGLIQDKTIWLSKVRALA